MKPTLLVILLLVCGMQLLQAQGKVPSADRTSFTKDEQRMLTMSRNKWSWFSEKQIDSLGELFHKNCVFVHMSGTWGKTRELEVIKKGTIWYKQARILASSVNFYDNIAVVLSDVDLDAVVGGTEGINPFMVTEVYIGEEGSWKLISMSFSRTVRTKHKL